MMATLSEKEWTVLDVLWQTEGAELGVIAERLRPATGWSRNTVLTYLTRMEAKGLVRIDKAESPHIYYAAIEREACRAKERRSFLRSVYQGATGDLVAAFLKEERISKAERERLKKLLDDMEV